MSRPPLSGLATHGLVTEVQLQKEEFTSTQAHVSVLPQNLMMLCIPQSNL